MSANVNAESDNLNVQEGLDEIRERILHLLEIFPYLSRSMIQIGLGPNCSPKFWDPVLTQLVELNKIKLVETTVASPGGRALQKGIYHLPKYPYPPASVATIEDHVELLSAAKPKA